MGENIEKLPDSIIKETPKISSGEKFGGFSNKYLFIGLGMIVLATVIFSFYHLIQKSKIPSSGPKIVPSIAPLPTPTPELTSGWLTYINPTYHYSLKYPIEFSQSMDKDAVKDLITYFKNPDRKIAITVGYEAQGSDCANAACNPTRILDLKINGRNYSVQEHFPDTFNNYSFQVNLTNDQNRHYQITAKYAYLEDEKIISQILATFKFLDVPPVKATELMGQTVFCQSPRSKICTMECLQNPPYICGSDGKSYCSTCQACANSKVGWYMVQNRPCDEEFVCPENNRLNCMPIVDPNSERAWLCSKEYLDWAKENCPGLEVVY